MRFLGVQNPSWSVTKKVPSGFRQTPFGGPEAGGEDVGLRAVLAHLEQRAVVRHEGGQGVPAALGVVEVPLGVGLQPHRELVEVLGHLVVAVEALVEVGLAVAVQVGQLHELVAAADEDHAVAHLQPERLEQPRGDPLPRQPAFGVVDAADRPHVAVPGADGHPLAVREEVEPGGPQQGVPRVAVGGAERVGGERAVGLAEGGGRLQHLRPPLRPALGERLERLRCGRRLGESGEVGGPLRHQHLHPRRRGGGGDAQDLEPVLLHQ